MATSSYYITDGSVRGRCDHHHRTISGAERCLAADHAGCAAQGGYSDRYIYRMPGGHRMIDDGDGNYLSVDEWQEFDDDNNWQEGR